jgi:hypothetical protein
VQSSRGRLCAFWLAALLSILQTAPSLAAASLALCHFSAYLWSYTGAAVPVAMRRPLLAAIERAQTLPAQTAGERRAAARRAANAPLPHGEVWERAEPAGAVPRAALGACNGCVAAARLRRGEPAHKRGARACHPGATWGRLPVDLCDRTDNYVSQVVQSAHAAGLQHVRMALTVILRGHGLCSSAFAIDGARAEAQATLARWLDLDLAQLSKCGLRSS